MNRNSSSDMEMAADPLQSEGKVGYRFHPYDHELVGHFLTSKRHGLSNNDGRVIGEVEIYNKEPWDLPDLSPNRWGDLVWYFYCKPVRKYKNSLRSSRTTEAGYWKSTGKTRIVRDKLKKVIGTKKTLVFHKGRPKGVGTEWVMHEYECSSNPNMPFKDDYVLYKLKKKPNNKTAKEEPKGINAPSTPERGEPSGTKNSEFGHQNPDEITAIPATKEGATSHAVVPDVENQISVSDLGAWNMILFDEEGEPASPTLSDFDNPISFPMEGGYSWSSSNVILFDEEGEPDGLSLSDLYNPISFPTEGGRSLLPATPSDFQNHPAGLMLSDLENENIALPLKKQSDISAYEEREQATQVALPSDACLQNQYQNSDSSTFEGGHQGPLMASSFQNQWSSEIVDFGNDQPNNISYGQGPSMALPPDFGFNSQSDAPTLEEDFWSSWLETLDSDSISGGMPS